MAIGCNNKTESKTDDSSTAMASSSEKIDYAYLPIDGHQPDNWDRGDQKNVAMVLNSLKAWADGNIDLALRDFADSVAVAWDGLDQKVSKDTLLKWFQHDFSVQIRMDDYEAVTSKDKKDNWVSLWYTEIHTDKTGKVDSVFNMDDLKIENGKIARLDQKTRKFPKPKS